ncbi:MAG: peptidase M20, partial [Sphingobium yanoikuyae]
MKRFALCIILASTALSVPVRAATPTSATAPADARAIAAIRARPAVKAAFAALEAEHDQWVDNIVTLTQIPAPPFKEEARAKAYADMLRAAGLTDVEIDEGGNVLGLRRGSGKPGGKLIVVSAHLDTVF